MTVTGHKMVDMSQMTDAGHASPVTTAGYAAFNQADAAAAVAALPAPRHLKVV